MPHEPEVDETVEPSVTGDDDLMTRQEVAYKFAVASVTVKNWAKNPKVALTEVKDDEGKPAIALASRLTRRETSGLSSPSSSADTQDGMPVRRNEYHPSGGRIRSVRQRAY